MIRGVDAPARVLQLGEPGLRTVSRPVHRGEPDLDGECRALIETLDAFRKAHGFGRAIAAPQIGVSKRFLAIDLGSVGQGSGYAVLLNPEITARSDETFELWDDCMSFPDLLVRVERHACVNVSFMDENAVRHEWQGLDRATSELLQHEIDHLDGILAVDRAVDRDALMTRAAFERVSPTTR